MTGSGSSDTDPNPSVNLRLHFLDFVVVSSFGFSCLRFFSCVVLPLPPPSCGVFSVCGRKLGWPTSHLPWSTVEARLGLIVSNQPLHNTLVIIPQLLQIILTCSCVPRGLFYLCRHCVSCHTLALCQPPRGQSRLLRQGFGELNPFWIHIIQLIFHDSLNL